MLSRQHDELMPATMLSPEVVLKVGDKTVVFGKLLQFLEDNFLSDLSERKEKND